MKIATRCTMFDLDASIKATETQWFRDPVCDCKEFTIQPDFFFRDCPGDGHYMCKVCTRFEERL